MDADIKGQPIKFSRAEKIGGTVGAVILLSVFLRYVKWSDREARRLEIINNDKAAMRG